MKRLYCLLVSFCLLFLSSPLSGSVIAQEPDNLPDVIPNVIPENMPEVTLEDGNIVIESDAGKKILDYDNDTDKYAPYKNLKKWRVSDKPDSVSEALSVFKKKGQALHTEKFWIINKEDGSQKIVVEYSTFDKQSQMIFSPDEDYVYYKTVSDFGETMIFGINLDTNNKFLVGDSSDFYITTCPDNESYISLLNDEIGQERSYVIYKLDGTWVNILNEDISFHNLEEYICY